ncbi:MAG: alanine racemase [Pseudomonadota bacterium]
MTTPLPAGASGRLTIDLSALAANWRYLDEISGQAKTAGLIKGDAYGMGIAHIAPVLREAGCRTFFVATVSEARRARAALGSEPVIYMLDGFLPGAAPAMREAEIRPVLGSLPEIEDWAGVCQADGNRRPAAIHIDTGMNRLGLEVAEVEALAARPELLASFTPKLCMSHFACADEPAHPLNVRQEAAFAHLRALLPDMPASLANSPATLTRPDSYFDLVRPGVACYGGRAVNNRPNPMRPVVTLDVPVLQVRNVTKGDTVGYGAGHTATRDSRVAILSAGYADGLIRTGSARDDHPGANVLIAGHEAPAFGRVSMDLMAVDVTNLPAESVSRGTVATVFGAGLDVDTYADAADTIGYEMLTNLGRRFERVYVGANTQD